MNNTMPQGVTAPTLAQWLEDQEQLRQRLMQLAAHYGHPRLCEEWGEVALACEVAAAACWRGMESAPEDECEVCWVQPGVGSDDFYADALRSDRAVHDEGTFWCSSGERLSDLVAWRLLPDLPTLARESDDDEEWRREFFAGPQSSAFARDGKLDYVRYCAARGLEFRESHSQFWTPLTGAYLEQLTWQQLEKVAHVMRDATRSELITPGPPTADNPS